jgi:sulfide dehydrogenase cytochrome subunit
MSVDYFTATLQAFKKKARPVTEVTITAGDKKGSKSDMVKAIADLTDADFEALATEFAAKKFVKAKQTADAALAAKGKDVHDKLCDKCHTEAGSVAGDDAGILAGQWMPYVKAQLADFKSGKRPSPTKMQPKIDLMQASDIDALVAFYGSK